MPNYKDLSSEDQDSMTQAQFDHFLNRVPDLAEKMKKGHKLTEHEMQEVMVGLAFMNFSVLNSIKMRIPNISMMEVESIEGPDGPVMH